MAQTIYVGLAVTSHSNGVLCVSSFDNVQVRAASSATYVADLAWTSASNGWGPVEKDRSNGETGATDGRTITLNGTTHAKGLGVHASSDVRYDLNGAYSTFISDVGVDDEVGSRGSVVFQVYADGALL
jgi:hypothetical protein